MLRTDEVKRRREALGLTLAEAAQRAGFSSRQQWYNLEAGVRRQIEAETLYRVASALGCRMEDLVVPPAMPSQPSQDGAKRRARR